MLTQQGYSTIIPANYNIRITRGDSTFLYFITLIQQYTHYNYILLLITILSYSYSLLHYTLSLSYYILLYFIIGVLYLYVTF
jgi:hypothetical protein